MIWRRVVWLLYVGIWTWALLLPNPDRLARALILPETVPEPEHHPVRQEILNVVSSSAFPKWVHVACYALLAILSGWQRAFGGYRWGLLAFMTVHAVGTELLQAFVPGRHSSWLDVGFDHLGIALGLVLTWRCWFNGSPRAESR
jgi:hypothetical protein